MDPKNAEKFKLNSAIKDDKLVVYCKYENTIMKPLMDAGFFAKPVPKEKALYIYPQPKKDVKLIDGAKIFYGFEITQEVFDSIPVIQSQPKKVEEPAPKPKPQENVKKPQMPQRFPNDRRSNDSLSKYQKKEEKEYPALEQNSSVPIMKPKSGWSEQVTKAETPADSIPWDGVDDGIEITINSNIINVKMQDFDSFCRHFAHLVHNVDRTVDEEKIVEDLKKSKCIRFTD